MLEVVPAANDSRRGHPTAANGKNGQNDQGYGHVLRRLVNVHVVLVVTLRPEKREENQAEHVKRGKPRGEYADPAEDGADTQGFAQDFILVEEARNARR